MNIQEIRNKNYRLVDTSKTLARESKLPIMRYNWKNPEHEIEKLKKCMELRSQGHWLLTEVNFKAGGRADIFDLDTGIAMEITNTETKESIASKKQKYPVEVVEVKA